MSVEGLLSEVFATWNTRLTIRAADQAFFGGKQVYTNVPLTACDGGNKGGDTQKQGGQDQLGTAIKNAQNVIDKALAGQSVGGGNDQKVHADIAALKKENQDIKKEVAELRKLIEKLSVNTSSRLLFGDSQRVLILGDGNLSFSLSLATLFPNKYITATVLEDEATFVEVYAEGKKNIAHLRELVNVELRFSTDATALSSMMSKGGHDTVIMNFPHPGGKTNLKRSRALARGVFRSLRERTAPSVEFNLSLAVGQSGIPYEAPTWTDVLPDHRCDSWQVLQIASEEGWLLQEVLPMVPWLFPGYKSAGYKSTTKGFNNYTAAQRLVFKKYDKTENFDYLRDCDGSLFCTLRPFFVRDISCLFTCPLEEIEKNEATLLTMIKDVAGSMVRRIDEVPELRSICPNPCLPNRIYRIYWQTTKVPLTRSLCNLLDEILRQRILQHIDDHQLPFILT